MGVMNVFLVGVPGRSETGDFASFGPGEGNMVERKLAIAEDTDEEGYSNFWR